MRQVIFEMRTDEGFKNDLYSSNQKKVSPLIQRNICCISSFVPDYMHLVCLGGTRRIRNFLLKGPAICGLSHAQLALVSEYLVSLRSNIPCKQRCCLNLIDGKPLSSGNFSSKQDQ